MRKRFPEWLAAALFALAVLVFTKEAAAAAASSLSLCASAVIPSLFPMLFAASWFSAGGGASAVGDRLAGICGRLFGFAGEGGAVLLMCVLGGYPAGAVMTASLYGQGAISREDAERMTGVCFCAGPGFLIGTVGEMYCGSRTAGMILLTAQVMSVIILALLTRSGNTVSAPRNVRHDRATGSAFVSSAEKASKAMLGICSYIIIFGVITSLLSSCGLTGLLARIAGSERLANALLYPVLEVTSGCSHAARAGLPFVGFAVGFGGIAVHFQIFSIAREIKISRGRFVCLRLIQGLLCSFLTWLLGKMIIGSGAVTASAPTVRTAFPYPGGSALLLIMCAAFLLSTPAAPNKRVR